jgi:hypothetical protein
LTAAQNVPSGTIELKGGSVAAGVGYTWGKGILVFDGQEYPVKVSGLSIVQVGVSSYTASGTVYDLTKVSDINGIYTAVSAGAAVGGGASATAMKNDQGFGDHLRAVSDPAAARLFEVRLRESSRK